MPEVTVNGETVEAEEGELVFELLRRLDFEIPHFCYHPELSLAGACRMCMVEMDGTVDISCTRRVEDEMEIVTDNKDVAEARRGILEFMLVNHPLDCPVCDKGGECPLQDYTMGYGPAQSRFHGNKRTFPKFDLGELLTQRQNRCILCYRCTRFYQEEGGREDFRVIQRGNEAFVGKQPGGQLESELSGNMVDICPTGTIVTKPYLHKSRPWENEPVKSIAGMDPLQTPIIADVRGDEIMRIRPQEEPDFPKPWIDDRVRFVHEYNSDEERRLELPRNEQYFDRFDRILGRFDESENVAGIISADRTLEEMHLFRSIFRQRYGSDQVSCYPESGGITVDPVNFEDVMDSDFILIAGTDFRQQYPMLTPFLRTAARRGAELAYLSYWGNELTIEPDVYMRNRPEEFLKRVRRLSEGRTDDATDRAILDRLESAESPVFISCEGQTVGAELTRLALDWEAPWEYMRLAPGGNSKSAERVFRDAPSVSSILERAAEGEIDALFLYGMDLLRDFPNRDLVSRAMGRVSYLAGADYLHGEWLDGTDDILPLTTQFEEEGILINAEGRIRKRPVVTEPDERILTGFEMLSFWEGPDDDMRSREKVADEIREQIPGIPELDLEDLEKQSSWIEPVGHEVEPSGTEELSGTRGQWALFSEPYLYSSDRRAQIGQSLEGLIREPVVECHEADAESLGADRDTELVLQVNGDAIRRPVKITNSVPEGSLLIPWNLQGDEDLRLFDTHHAYRRVKIDRPESEAVREDG